MVTLSNSFYDCHVLFIADEMTVARNVKILCHLLTSRSEKLVIRCVPVNKVVNNTAYLLLKVTLLKCLI